MKAKIIIVVLLIAGVLAPIFYMSMDRDNCPRDAKVCGGKLLYREEETCTFPECAGGDSTNCPNETKICEDSTIVTRTGQSCVFSLCPEVASKVEQCFIEGVDKAECVTEVAVEYGDEDLCNLAGTKAGGISCIEEVFVALGDISQCGRLRFSKSCEERILAQQNS